MSSPRKLLRSLIGSFFVSLGVLEILMPRIINWVLGSFFLSIGVVGVILPVLNGTFFLILGFILISFESKYVEEKLHRLTSKNTTIHTWHLYLEKWLRKYFVKRDE